MSLCENFWNRQFERLKEERNILLEDVSVYKMDERNLRVLHEKEVDIKLMTPSVVELEKTSGNQFRCPHGWARKSYVL